MIDTDLWCRFFLYDELWHVDRVLGGYRMTGLNRCHNFKIEVSQDINKSLNFLANNLSYDKKILIEKMKKYSVDFQVYQKNINKLSTSLRKNILLQCVPHFMYKKLAQPTVGKSFWNEPIAQSKFWKEITANKQNIFESNRILIENTTTLWFL